MAELGCRWRRRAPNTTAFNLLKTLDTYAALYKGESSGEDSLSKSTHCLVRLTPDPIRAKMKRWRPGKPSSTASWDYCLVSFPFGQRLHWKSRPKANPFRHAVADGTEKMQMELSHKRARIELEKTANLNADKFEREAESNQELLKRIKLYQEKETEAKNALQEQLEVNKTCQNNIEALNEKLQEKETKLAEANKVRAEPLIWWKYHQLLEGKVSESQWNTMNQETEMKKQQSQNQELTEQVDVLHKKWQEAVQHIQVLQAKEQLMSKTEQKIQVRPLTLFLLYAPGGPRAETLHAGARRGDREEHEEEAGSVSPDGAGIAATREENTYLRKEKGKMVCLALEMRDNNGLLKEQVEGLQRKLERFEKVQAERVALELENKKLRKNWTRTRT
ncbi:hypothetical protein E2320_012251 [Naja naja]|nr:hypothetical protein E2320_012251 [Naja naja]